MEKGLERVRAFLYGWLVEGGLGDSLAPPRAATLYGLCYPLMGLGRPQEKAWRILNTLENAVEAWAIELDVPLGSVDEAHPDVPMADNIIRKLMVIRGAQRA
jgi:hypothetical protein